MIVLAKYATQDIITFPMMKAGTKNFAASGDWTPATGDVKFSLDQSGVSNTTNLPSNVGGTGSGLWALTVSGSELTGKQCVVQIVDAATKAVDDQAIIIRTYGHASAYYPFDLSATFLAQMTTALNTAQTESYAADGAEASLVQLGYMILAVLTEWSKSGTTMTAKKLDGSTTAGTFSLDDATNPTSITRSS